MAKTDTNWFSSPPQQAGGMWVRNKTVLVETVPFVGLISLSRYNRRL
jgi:hypothetical protein